MKNFIIILALFMVVTGSYASNAFVADINIICVDTIDYDSNDECQDCECHHNHVISFNHLIASHQPIINDLLQIKFRDNWTSKITSSLYRPPIV